MNAPATITPLDAYQTIVLHHLPGIAGEEVAIRCALLRMRDKAGRNLHRCSDEAYGSLAEVQRLATLYAFARIPIEELRELRHRLNQLILAANGLEQMAYRLTQGETDARG